jgi:hypothetical protein
MRSSTKTVSGFRAPAISLLSQAEMMPISQVEEMHAGSILARRYVRYEMVSSFHCC